MEAKVLRSCWQWRNYPPGHDGGGARADAEVLLNAPGRQLLAGLCGVEEDVLARALPSWRQEDAKLSAGKDGVPAAAWRTGGAVAGPVAFGCRLCAARRTGTAVRVVRYAPRWERVCVRHGRWLLDADADQPLEHLDLRGLPEVVAAQRRWTGVARRAVRAGAEPERVFALAHAVVARWWEQALHWERENDLAAAAAPGRGRQRRDGSGAVADRGARRGRLPRGGGRGRRAAGPGHGPAGMARTAGGRPRVRAADDPFCRRLGERVGGTGWGRWPPPTTAAR